MEDSILYEVIFRGVLSDCREKIEADDDCGFVKKFRELENAVKASFTDKDKDLILKYGLALTNYLEHIHYCLSVKLVNLCLKMGMQIEKAFSTKKILSAINNTTANIPICRRTYPIYSPLSKSSNVLIVTL